MELAGHGVEEVLDDREAHGTDTTDTTDTTDVGDVGAEGFVGLVLADSAYASGEALDAFAAVPGTPHITAVPVSEQPQHAL